MPWEEKKTGLCSFCLESFVFSYVLLIFALAWRHLFWSHSKHTPLYQSLFQIYSILCLAQIPFILSHSVKPYTHLGSTEYWEKLQCCTRGRQTFFSGLNKVSETRFLRDPLDSRVATASSVWTALCQHLEMEKHWVLTGTLRLGNKPLWVMQDAHTRARLKWVFFVQNDLWRTNLKINI